MSTHDGGPAFPTDNAHQTGTHTWRFEGMSLRDYFAAHAPEPTEDEISRIMKLEHAANPHNEPYHNKPRIRERLEIRCALRWKWADAMLKARGES